MFFLLKNQLSASNSKPFYKRLAKFDAIIIELVGFLYRKRYILRILLKILISKDLNASPFLLNYNFELKNSETFCKLPNRYFLQERHLRPRIGLRASAHFQTQPLLIDPNSLSARQVAFQKDAIFSVFDRRFWTFQSFEGPERTQSVRAARKQKNFGSNYRSLRNNRARRGKMEVFSCFFY